MLHSIQFVTRSQLAVMTRLTERSHGHCCGYRLTKTQHRTCQETMKLRNNENMVHVQTCLFMRDASVLMSTNSHERDDAVTLLL